MNPALRKVTKSIEPVSVLEGAGVTLLRSIASRELDYLDPFLLFDDFSSDNPDHYMRGFPWHPHRGIETVTYILDGFVDHRDSLGNAGRIGAGDVQWMTSGSGIMHEEMPKPREGKMAGFQLWVNLPASLKMTTPRYQDVAATLVPEVEREHGVRLRVIAGEVDGVRGPVHEIAAEPTYVDVFMPADATLSLPVERGQSAFAYVFEGEAKFGTVQSKGGELITRPRLAVFGDGDLVEVSTAGQSVRFLIVSGRPLNEPVARYGPFVMNTKDEIEEALSDLRNGTFIREQPESNPDQWYGVG